MHRELAETILIADETGLPQVFKGHVIPASCLFDYLTDCGIYPEESESFFKLHPTRDSQIDAIMRFSEYDFQYIYGVC